LQKLHKLSSSGVKKIKALVHHAKEVVVEASLVYHFYQHPIQPPIFIVPVSTTSDPVKRQLVLDC